jgi:hypothetical protein
LYGNTSGTAIQTLLDWLMLGRFSILALRAGQPGMFYFVSLGAEAMARITFARKKKPRR